MGPIERAYNLLTGPISHTDASYTEREEQELVMAHFLKITAGLHPQAPL